MGGGCLVAHGVGGDGGARLVSRHIEDFWLSQPKWGQQCFFKRIFSARNEFKDTKQGYDVKL